MASNSPQRTEAERESRILLGVAGGVGCLVVLCIITSAIAILLAYVWTIQGNLGPASSGFDALFATMGRGPWL